MRAGADEAAAARAAARPDLLDRAVEGMAPSSAPFGAPVLRAPGAPHASIVGTPFGSSFSVAPTTSAATATTGLAAPGAPAGGGPSIASVGAPAGGMLTPQAVAPAAPAVDRGRGAPTRPTARATSAERTPAPWDRAVVPTDVVPSLYPAPDAHHLSERTAEAGAGLLELVREVGVPRSREEAQALWERAERAGFTGSRQDAARLWQQVQEVAPRSREEARHIWQQVQQSGVPRTRDEARRLWERAQQAGVPGSRDEARAYWQQATGQSAPRNLREAVSQVRELAGTARGQRVREEAEQRARGAAQEGARSVARRARQGATSSVVGTLGRAIGPVLLIAAVVVAYVAFSRVLGPGEVEEEMLAGQAHTTSLPRDTTLRLDLTVPAAGVYFLTAESGGRSDLTLALEDAAGSQLATNDDATGAVAAMVDTPFTPGILGHYPAGTYSLLVTEYNGAPVDDLTVSVTDVGIALVPGAVTPIEVPADGAWVGYLDGPGGAGLLADVRADAAGTDLVATVITAEGEELEFDDRDGSAPPSPSPLDPYVDTGPLPPGTTILVVSEVDGRGGTGTVATEPS